MFTFCKALKTPNPFYPTYLECSDRIFDLLLKRIFKFTMHEYVNIFNFFTLFYILMKNNYLWASEFIIDSRIQYLTNY